MKTFLKFQGIAILILLPSATIICVAIYVGASGTRIVSPGIFAFAAIAVVYGIPFVIVGGTVAFLTTRRFDALKWQKPAAFAIGLIAIVPVGFLYTMLSSALAHEGQADMFEYRVLRAFGFSFPKIDSTKDTLEVILVNAKHRPQKENMVTTQGKIGQSNTDDDGIRAAQRRVDELEKEQQIRLAKALGKSLPLQSSAPDSKAKELVK